MSGNSAAMFALLRFNIAVEVSDADEFKHRRAKVKHWNKQSLHRLGMVDV